MFNTTTEERISVEVACRASNSLQQIVSFKRQVVEGAAYIRFTLFHRPGTGTSWPAEMIQEGREADLAEAVAAALSEQIEKPVSV